MPKHPIENVSLDNTRLEFEGGGTREDALKTVPEKPESYPESTMFGALPAYGFYCRHVDVRWSQSDARPALICEDVRGLALERFHGQTLPDGFALVILNDVHDGLIRGCRAPDQTNAFMRITGDSQNLSVIGNDLSGAKIPFEFHPSTLQKTFFQVANRLLSKD